MKDQIFRFSGELCDWKDTDQSKAKKHLGGKGAGLVMMAQAGMPVPPGFTITTDVCNEIATFVEPALADGYKNMLMLDVVKTFKWLDKQFGYRPLVSVRSGAPVSMPGMMDTILNVGLHNGNIDEWAERIGERAAWDSYRRLVQMLGQTAYGVEHKEFEQTVATIKAEKGVVDDKDLTTEHLKWVVACHQATFTNHTGFDFPQDPMEQVRVAVDAVFKSWMNPRAIEYRKLNNIDSAMGTAVTVQAMVFGNMGDDSGTGVLFTRNPSTGENQVMGEFLQNAQGEDVVAGIRTPRPLTDMPKIDNQWGNTAAELLVLCEKLEEVYKDMVDIEFTVQNGKLFLLQSRVGKRSAAAAFKIATDLANDGVISIDEALARLTPEQYKVVKRPTIDPKFKHDPNMVGLAACPGVVTGKPVFSAQEAIDCKVPCILITHETNPDDIGGIHAAVGILTQTGGATSHAAVVARAMDKACVVGCTAMSISDIKKHSSKVTIDGSTGRVWLDMDVPMIDSSELQAVKDVQNWCLAKSGKSIATPVDLGVGVPQRIYAAYWWGHEEVADAIFASLAEYTDLYGVVLDIRPPREFVGTADYALLEAFGSADTGPSFVDYLTKLKLNMPASNTKGLQLGACQELALGAVPVDYAVFEVLGTN